MIGRYYWCDAIFGFMTPYLESWLLYLELWHSIWNNGTIFGMMVLYLALWCHKTLTITIWCLSGSSSVPVLFGVTERISIKNFENIFPIMINYFRKYSSYYYWSIQFVSFILRSHAPISHNREFLLYCMITQCNIYGVRGYK